MNLRDFVRETLVEIQYGIQAASNECAADPNFRGVINPVWGEGVNAINGRHIRLVEFDVAVSVTETATADGKSGIKVFSVAEGPEGIDQKSVNSTVSHIKFAVPIVPAVTIVRPG
jgi:hypothetical protein